MNSMTGFGKSSVKTKDMELTCEIKTLNHRFLQTRLNLHPYVEQYDILLNKMIRQSLKRGYAVVSINVNNTGKKSLLFSGEKLKKIYNEIKPIVTFMNKSISITLSDILSLQDRLNLKPVIPQSLIALLLRNSMKKLLTSRAIEGKQIKKLFANKINKMKTYTAKIDRQYPAILEKNKTKIDELLKSVSGSDHSVIKGELFSLIDKSMIAEEIERIKFHLSKLASVINGSASMGKEITFLLQELTREINTLSSKAGNSEVQYNCVKMRELAEELREQSENIE